MEKDLYKEIKDFLYERKGEITKETIVSNDNKDIKAIKNSFGRIVCNSHLGAVIEYEKKRSNFYNMVEGAVKAGKTIISESEETAKTILAKSNMDSNSELVELLSNILIKETEIFLQKVREIYEREKVHGNL